MKQEDAITIICNVLENRFCIKSEHLGSEHWNEPFTGASWRFTAIDLAYLFLEIEKEFNIKIEAERLLNQEFNTILGIAALPEIAAS
ncbi:MAG: hypothetical protein WAX04_10555 [Oscillospiraceae bacterium]